MPGMNSHQATASKDARAPDAVAISRQAISRPSLGSIDLIPWKGGRAKTLSDIPLTRPLIGGP